MTWIWPFSPDRRDTPTSLQGSGWVVSCFTVGPLPLLCRLFPCPFSLLCHIWEQSGSLLPRQTKKDLYSPDNHDGVITHLEPDILECEVKWNLGSITANKASGGDGIPAELFQILKDGAVKVLHSVCQQVWKTQQWPQDWKKCFHSNPKVSNAREYSNYCTIALISHACKVILKIL